MVLLDKLGEAMRKGRKERGLTQEKFAEMCGISTREVSNIENGKTEPKFGTLISICQVCNIGMEEFITQTNGEEK